MDKLKNLPLLRQLGWLLNSRKAVVAILGILSIVGVRYLGLEEAVAKDMSEKILIVVGILISAIAYEDGKKGDSDADFTGS
ncbi:hypothetical protein LCGC14_1040810 [marine sediment metagenome]|uniref:Uncharacterized protein n=1 Tax=marine sediment metagenome TaxID=412755 RepID=A0A0F9QA07_9ZZZZ